MSETPLKRRGFVILGNCFPISQALSKGRVDNVDSALTVAVFARVPATVKLGQIARNVLVADVVESADDAALQ